MMRFGRQRFGGEKLGRDELPAREVDLRRCKLVAKRVGDDVRHLRPLRERIFCLVINLGGVQAKEDIFRSGKDRSLKRDDIHMRVPKAVSRHTFGAEERSIEFPEFSHATGFITQQNRLSADEMAA